MAAAFRYTRENNQFNLIVKYLTTHLVFKQFILEEMYMLYYNAILIIVTLICDINIHVYSLVKVRVCLSKLSQKHYILRNHNVILV